jgi:predicted transcriptional regulator
MARREIGKSFLDKTDKVSYAGKQDRLSYWKEFMVRKPQDVTDAELAILQVLWESGPAAIRHLTDVLYPGGAASQYATVQKLLERLEAKGYVNRDRSASVHIFSAAVGRDELIGRRLQAVAESLCAGSLTPLLTHLVRAQSLSAEERAALRSLIDEIDLDPRRGKSR